MSIDKKREIIRGGLLALIEEHLSAYDSYLDNFGERIKESTEVYSPIVYFGRDVSSTFSLEDNMKCYKACMDLMERTGYFSPKELFKFRAAYQARHVGLIICGLLIALKMDFLSEGVRQ